MLKNIRHNNVRGLKMKLRNDKFYDFMLYRGECVETTMTDECVVAEITPNNIVDGKITSTYTWGDAINEGVVLDNIGFTGVDNGIITFRKDRVNNAEFLNIYTNSKYVIDNGERSFFMIPVSGNTRKYDYPWTIEEEEGKRFFSLKGGFLQGFYKLFGQNYQTLPNVIDNEWNMEFVIRKREYEISEETLNASYPDNKGIFFYMGIRAENKFWESYNVPDKDKYINEDNICSDDSNCNIVDGKCIEHDYFIEDYDNNDGYYEDEMTLEGVELKTNTGKDVNKRGYYEIETDNKFLTFDRTGKGFTVDTFDKENSYVIFEGIKEHMDENYFLLMNRTPNGYNVDNIGKYHEQHKKEFDIYQDIRENAFALKINDDGSIGYKYAVTDCEADNKCSFAEEMSKSNVVVTDEWCTVNLKIKTLDSAGSYGSRVGERKIKIYLYVNGNLVLVSKELPEFKFRELNDIEEKQETVPYNISLGGGTQGLCDGIWLNYSELPKYRLPLEENFAGTFIGDIMSFRFYDCFMDYKTINDMVFNG